MKKNIFLYFIAITTCTLMISCEKNGLTFSDSIYNSAKENALVKIAFYSPYRLNPRYQIKVNGVRIGGNLPYNNPYPGGGFNTPSASNTADYAALNSGVNKITVTIPKVGTETDSVTLATTEANFISGKKSTLYFSDTTTNTTTLVVEDSLSTPDSGFAKYKFVNLIPDAPALDLYIGTTKVASNIPYKGVSSSFLVATNVTSFTWRIRDVNATTDLATYAGSASGVGNQRIYTVVARGYKAISATSDPRVRSISMIYNQ